ncbi:glycosyltransferase [Tissierella sp.]|uniref:glycosyltransferase n=1 Tax=Tissierella sp. TaxID=41274 RepID=UPI0030D7CA55
MIQLQSILLPDKSVCEISELYYHKKGNRIDYNGYFNLFYIEKRKKYTDIGNLKISICLCGYERLILVHDGVDIREVKLEPKSHKEYLIDFPYGEYDKGCFWFALYEDKSLLEKSINGYFGAEPIDFIPRKINIGIDICTFKREEYVARNLKQLKEKILSNPSLEVSNHIGIYIIDNGRTLQDCNAVQLIVRECRNKITIVPNINAGGAGGFSRGMIEVLKDRDSEHYTHILLMDDDAIVEPDLLVRIYGFLSTVKEIWKDITIGGALLREDYPYLLLCAGEWWKKGKTVNTEANLDLRTLLASSSKYLTGTGNEYDGQYSGWWCCCYSLNVVRSDNMPIPLFIHRDDIEFGLRNAKYGITFLNGVGVWHRGFEYSIDANGYYDVRNTLIELAINKEKGKKMIAIKMVLKLLLLSVIRLTYKEADLVYRGVIDFLRGPAWLYGQKPGELNLEIREMACQMYSIKDLKKFLSEEEYLLVKQQIEVYERSMGNDITIPIKSPKTKATIWHYMTFNGWILPAKQKHIKVIATSGSPFDAFREKTVVWYESSNGKVYLTQRHYKELFRIIYLCVKSIVVLYGSFDKAAFDYQKHIGDITTQAAWEKYLELN